MKNEKKNTYLGFRTPKIWQKCQQNVRIFKSLFIKYVYRIVQCALLTNKELQLKN